VYIVAKGKSAPLGSRYTAKNGYLYQKTEKGWELVHRLLAEERLGRPLEEGEYVIFLEGCSKEDPDPNLLEVRRRGRASLKRRIAQVEGKIQELQAHLDVLKERLKLQKEL